MTDSALQKEKEQHEGGGEGVVEDVFGAGSEAVRVGESTRADSCWFCSFRELSSSPISSGFDSGVTLDSSDFSESSTVASPTPESGVSGEERTALWPFKVLTELSGTSETFVSETSGTILSASSVVSAALSMVALSVETLGAFSASEA